MFVILNVVCVTPLFLLRGHKKIKNIIWYVHLDNQVTKDT